jgi:hypothetical protein
MARLRDIPASEIAASDVIASDMAARRLPPSRSRRLVIASVDGARLLAQHAPLIAAATAARHTVHCLAPAFPPTVQAALSALGVTWEATPFVHAGFSPLAAYRVRRDLAGRLAAAAPQALLIEPEVPLAPLVVAARAAAVPRIAARLDADVELDPRAARTLADLTDVIVPAARLQRRLRRALPDATRVHLLPAASLDVSAHGLLPMPSLDEGVLIRCMTASEDVAAHKLFQTSVRSLARPALKVRFATGRSLEQLAAAHVVVHLPSASGLDPAALVALAVGRPLIVADRPLVADLVDECVNGWRVAPGDSEALTQAIRSAFRLAALLPVLGRASRCKVERHFDRRAATRGWLACLDLDASPLLASAPEAAAA